MELKRHPEYGAYLQDRETDRRWRRAVAAWSEPVVVEAYGLRWTPAGARAFVRALARLFRQYNRVLWEQFPYCRQCDGGCCVLGATRVTPFDAIASALLGLDLPRLAERIEAGARACRYHAAAGCTWPAEWRPVKCWSFYCAQGEPSGPLVARLAQVVGSALPDALRRYEAAQGEPLVARLDDPVGFAGALDRALAAVLVEPLRLRSPEAGEEPSPAGEPEEATPPQAFASLQAFIAEAADQVSQSWSGEMSISPDQFLADLELLEWIVAGRPEHGPRLLAEMLPRYVRAPAPAEGEGESLLHRMRGHLLHLQENWERAA